MSDVRTRGSWPEPVQIRRGWASARARPWNDQTQSIASLRLDRGNDRFLVACCDWLTGQGVERVLSPALAEMQAAIWRRAGFAHHLELVVFERGLARAAPPPAHDIIQLDEPDYAELARIDDQAFNSTWRVGRRGLEDAVAATPLSVVLAVESGQTCVGFLIVGEVGGVSYLQRLAVDPAATRNGVGRSLVRAAIGWARARGARTMLLNTQPENTAAAALYDSEGFVAVNPGLRVLARTGEIRP